MTDNAGIWFEDETCLNEPVEVTPYKKYDLLRQGQNDVITLSPHQIKQIRTYWDMRYPECRPDHLMAKPDISLAGKRLMSIAMMLAVSFVFMNPPLPDSIRFHYGRKPVAMQVASVMPLPLSPFPSTSMDTA